jgi:flagellar L-ring protein precursor FlgH
MLLIMMVLLPGRAALADSLWSRRTPNGGFLFVDNHARQVGDLLTIVVQENTDIDFNETRDASKQTNSAGVFTFGASTTGNVNTRQSNAAVNIAGGATRSLNGTSQFTSDRAFTDRMTVTVQAVMPNGNLVIEGERVRVVSGETRTLHVSGEVRPLDVGPNNTVLSQYIANFHCIYAGKGQESHFTSFGWWNKCISKVWPF